jgi:hypothetical protein
MWGVYASVLLRGAAVVASLVVAAAARISPTAVDWPRVLTAIGLCFLVRGILEPVGFAYYLGPGAAVLTLALVVVAERGKGRSGADRSRVFSLGLLPAVAIGAVLWSLADHGSGWGWWLPDLALCAVLAGGAVSAVSPPGPDISALRSGSTTLQT